MEHLRRSGLVRLLALTAVALALLAAPVAVADNGSGGGPFPQVSSDSGTDYVDLWVTVQALSLIY